jgi:cobalt-zinc-cadmium efflux system membrane fusion protein
LKEDASFKSKICNFPSAIRKVGCEVEKKSILAASVRAMPSFLVLVGLGLLAFWGHRTGWTMPKFSELIGSRQTDPDDWCAEHDVPESECVECNPALLPKQEFGWCKNHGIPNCPLEHPQVSQLKTVPKISSAQLALAERALQFAQRQENNRKCKLYLRRIQFKSAEAVAKAGIDVTPAWEAPIVELVSASGQITYDQTRVARLSSRLPGSVWRVEKRVGDPIRPGEILALVEAAEVGKAKSEFLSLRSHADLKRESLGRLQAGYQKGAVALASLQEAETAAKEAEIRLLSAQQSLINLGLPIRAEDFRGLRPEEINRRLQVLGLESLAGTLDGKTTTTNLLPIKSPIEGKVVSREVVEGEVVDPAKVLFVVADTSQVWLTLDVRMEDAKHLALGQRVVFRPDGGDEDASGKIGWISSAADEKTRTLKVRADLENVHGQLRAFTFGAGRIILRQEANAVVVPNEAIQSDGDCLMVFVRDKHYFDKDAPKVFHVRTIRPGARTDQFTEVAAGLLPGEIVATKGSGGLRSELLKNNLGEG